MKVLFFYEDNKLLNTPNSATTYRELQGLLSCTDVLHTNETSALSFDNFKYFDAITIIQSDGHEITFYKPSNKYNIVAHNSKTQKELRTAHNLRRLWISGVFS